jgi:hypothetical protein
MATADLNFFVKVDLILGGKPYVPSKIRIASDSDTSGSGGPGQFPVQIEKVSEDEDPTSGDIGDFYLGAWIGGQSKAFSLDTINKDGVAEVRLSLAEKDPNTLKFAVVFDKKCARCTRRCNLASNFVHIPALTSMLSSGPRIGAPYTSAKNNRSGAKPLCSIQTFSLDQPCFSMRDNFTRNAAVLRFADAGSNLAAIPRLNLAPSSLLSLDRTNEAVCRLGKDIQGRISNFAVSPLNAGPQYMEAFTYGQMQGHLTHYAVLGHVFNQMSHPVDLPWMTYNICQAMQGTGLTVDALMAMPAVDFIQNFAVHTISISTACSLTSIYSSDLTLNAAGSVCKLRETEDIAKTFSCLSLQAPRSSNARPYSPPSANSIVPSLQQCITRIAECQDEREARGGLADRVTPHLFADDCENFTEGGMMLGKSYGAAYLSCEKEVIASKTKGGSKYVALDEAGHPTPDHLNEISLVMGANMARECAQTNPHVFSKLSRDHFRACGLLGTRMGLYQINGAWATDAGVVSAKGASYDRQDPLAAAQGLSGHGTIISRAKDLSSSMCSHSPVELTTYFSQDPSPPKPLKAGCGFADSFSVRLSDGRFESFKPSDFATVLGQNMHSELGASEDHCIQAHICSDYGDNPLDCPFYVSMFYSGLSEGPKGSIGCVPLDTAPPADFGAGCRPLFGAPVMGLSRKSTVALPVTVDMLGTDGTEILELMKAQVSEAWSPAAPPETIARIASFWQPCEPPNGPSAIFNSADDYARHMHSEATWAFDNPADTAKAVQLYQALAYRFNTIQARDAGSDGSRAFAAGKFLSASLLVFTPIPLASAAASGPVAFTVMRNLRRAAADLGLDKIAVMKRKQTMHVGASAGKAVAKTGPHFYMCHQGGGPTHAHRAKLA